MIKEVIRCHSMACQAKPSKNLNFITLLKAKPGHSWSYNCHLKDIILITGIYDKFL